MRIQPSNRQRAVVHSCEPGSMCLSEGQGHGLSAIRQRVASATPSKWQDAIVRSVHTDGTIVVAPFFAGHDVTLWNHADLSETLAVGEPVSLHDVYGVLAAGSDRYSVATVPAATV